MARRSGGWGSPQVQLAGVSVLYFLVQVALVRDVPLGWDESIYASQTDPRRPALAFSAPRARGTSLIAAPIQLVTGSPVALRVYLAVVAALGLYVAYAVWLRVVPNAAVPLAALGFSTLWLTVFYGPTTMPNVLIAQCAVLATGVLLRMGRGERARWLGWAGGGAIFVATLARPGDVAPLCLALAAAVVAHPAWRPRAVALLLPPAVGAVAGAVPWLVEAVLRYDGIVPRIIRALGAQSTSEHFRPDYQLRALDGPILCRPCIADQQPIPLPGLLMWVVGAVLVITAAWFARKRRGGMGRDSTLLPVFVGGSLAVPYLFLVGYAAPRFLLPAYALLAIPAAQALRLLLTRPVGSLRPVAAFAAAALFGAHLFVQHSYLEQVADSNTRSRAGWVRIARSLAAQGVVPPCTLVGPQSNAYAYVAGCDAVQVARRPGEEQFTLAQLQARALREPVALVLRRGDRPPDYARGWKPVPAGAMPRGYRAFLAPGAATQRSP